MHRLVFSGMIILALLSASPASAQSVDDDMRCLVLGTVFQGGAKEPTAKQAASAAALYFLGRVSARVPPGQLKRRYLAQATRLNTQTAGPMMNACFKQMQAQGKAVDAVCQEIARSLAKQPAPAKK
jgi:hypothetical protein